jgi:hypothetical protein
MPIQVRSSAESLNIVAYEVVFDFWGNTGATQMALKHTGKRNSEVSLDEERLVADTVATARAENMCEMKLALELVVHGMALLNCSDIETTRSRVYDDVKYAVVKERARRERLRLR